MNREGLILRNRSMTAAFHATPFRHRVRRGILRSLALIPQLPAHQPAAQRILLIRPDHLGDVLLTTPAIHALRQALPNAELHALVGPWSARVLANYADIDVVLTLPFPGFSRHPNDSLRSPYQLALNTARHLRRLVYSSAIIFRPDHWWGAMVTHLANIPERIGYNLADTAPFLTTAIEHQHEHAVTQSLRLVEQWRDMPAPEQTHYSFPVERIAKSYVDGYLETWGIRPEQPIFCIHPGSGTWVKHWQEERWAVIADTLTDQLDAQVVFTGSDHELPLVKRIVQHMHQPYCIIAGETNIGQLAALFGRARVVLGPDSGPLHLATAVGAPTVTLFGPADPAVFGPWGPRQKHLVVTTNIGCRPCRVLDWADDNPAYHPCMGDITVGQVLEAARRAANYE